MHCVTAIGRDIFYVGASDRRLALFENVYPIPDGVSYNSYLINDEKTVLLDTVDKSVSERFFENIDFVLSGKPLDYVIINHMEPDHAATLGELVMRYPGVKIVGTSKTQRLIKQFFNKIDVEKAFLSVDESYSLDTGCHKLNFVYAPMVHWPEVMVTYDSTTGTLFSADAFGTFGALDGSIFADDISIDNSFLSEARRYYTNIVGKYGSSVVSLLKKASALDIKTVCPLHGPIFRKDIGLMIDKYMHWATYTSEDSAVLIPYGTIYNNTENAACILANELAKLGITDVKLFDVSKTHHSYIVSEAFRCSHIVFASATYNNGIFSGMEYLLRDLAEHNLSFRKVAVIENGSWNPKSGEKIKKLLSEMNGITILQNNVSFYSSPDEETCDKLKKLAKEIFDSIRSEKSSASSASNKGNIEKEALFKLSYGLFVLSSSCNGRDNGCIINTAMQITDTPCRIAIALNKNNYTHDIISESGVFNISVISRKAGFDIFKKFGFVSGRDTDKFSDCSDKKRSSNGVFYLTEGINAYLSASVISSVDCGTHTLFTADVTEAKVLDKEASATYEYYFSDIKPKSGINTSQDSKKSQKAKIKGYICRICGFIYEGDTLPDDFICPICNHTADDFEPIYESDDDSDYGKNNDDEKNTSESGKKEEKKYLCSICGYVHSASELPDDFKCPACGASADMFVPVVDVNTEKAESKTKAAQKNVNSYICKICGYVYEGDTLPDDFTCPLCGVGADMFEPVSDEDKGAEESAAKAKAGTKNVNRYVCKICGYVYEGDTLPDDFTCPLCGVGADMFEQQPD